MVLPNVSILELIVSNAGPILSFTESIICEMVGSWLAAKNVSIADKAPAMPLTIEILRLDIDVDIPAVEVLATSAKPPVSSEHSMIASVN